MASAKKKLLNCFIPCGCGYRKPKPTSQATYSRRSPFSFSHRNGLFPATTSDNDEEGGYGDINGYTSHEPPSHDHNVEPSKSMRVVSPCRKITNSIAFVKDSDDPYRDFKRSMLEMIFEREISSKDDYEELLNCFLQFNPVSQHDVIILAFTEIWNGVFLEKKNKKNITS